MLIGDSAFVLSWFQLLCPTFIQEVLFVSTLLFNLKCDRGLFVTEIPSLKRVENEESCPEISIDPSLGWDYLFGFLACVISLFLSWFQLCGAALL